MEVLGVGADSAGGSAQGWAELEVLLRGIDKSSNRLDSLESIRDIVKANGCLPHGPLRARLLRAASSCAADPNSRIASKWLQLMADLATHHGEAIVTELDLLLPTCIEAMGSTSASVRQAAVQTMCACGKVRDHDVRLVLRGICECIEHSSSVDQRAECCAALVTIYSTAKYRTSVAEAQALQELVVPALAAALCEPLGGVAQSAANALEALAVRSPDALQAATDQLSSQLQKAVRSKVSGASPMPPGESWDAEASIGGGEDTSHRDGGSEPPPADKLETCNGAEGGCAGGSQGGASGQGLATAGSSLPFVPPRLLAELQDGNNWRVRALAVEELQALVKDLGDAGEIMAHVAQLVDFLVALSRDPNFKIEITALQTLGDLISLMGPEMRALEGVVMPELVLKLGDNKTLVRQANGKVLVKLMAAVGPDAVVSTLLKHLGNSNWRVREEVLLLAMHALLAFEKRLDLDAMVKAAALVLEDDKSKVRLTALETLALLHAALGGDRFQAQLPALDASVERVLQARLAQQALPLLNAEGVVELPSLRGQALEDTAATSGGTPRGVGEMEPPRSPLRRERGRAAAAGGGAGDHDSDHLDERCATASPCRRADMAPTTSPVRFGGAMASDHSDSPRAGRRSGDARDDPLPLSNAAGPRIGSPLATRRGSAQLGLELSQELGALLAGDDQPLYSEVSVDERAASRGGGGAGALSGGILRSPRRMGNGGDSSGRGTPRANLEQVPEDTHDGLGQLAHGHAHGAGESLYGEGKGSAAHRDDLFKPASSSKPIKPFWMDGLRSDAGAHQSDARDSLHHGAGGKGAVMPPAHGGAMGGGMATGVAGGRGDSFNRVGAGARMRPPSAGRRAAGMQGGGLSGVGHEGALGGGGGGDGYYQAAPPGGQAQGGMRMVGAWGVGVEDTRFESLPGLTSSSPMICSPPMSPQSVRACPSPTSQMRMLNAQFNGQASQINSELSSASTVSRDNVPHLEKAYSEDLMRGPASVPTRTAGSMGGGALADDVSLSQEKIASRLSILKTRRGRTSSSRRGPNSMSAPANETPLLGLGDTHPSLGSSLLGSSMQDLGAGQAEAALEADAAAYRPSQSAPSLSGSKGQASGLGLASKRDVEARHHDRDGQMQVEAGGTGTGAGGQRSAMDISAKPIELVPTEELKPADNPESCMRSLISKLGNSDWAVQMDALNNLRALSIYHASVTILPQLHAVVRAVLVVVDNLRSNLSKSALMSLTDMLKYLRTAMDPELDQVVLVCVKKSADTAGFIADEAKRAMHAMIHNCTEQRTISALVAANSNKNPLIRAKVAVFVAAVIETLGSRLCAMREQERLFQLVVRYLSEGNAEPRAAGKRAMLQLYEHNSKSGEFERLLRRCADADIRVVEKLLAQEHALHGAFAVTAHAHSRASNLGASLPRSSRSSAPAPPAASRDARACGKRAAAAAAAAAAHAIIPAIAAAVHLPPWPPRPLRG